MNYINTFRTLSLYTEQLNEDAQNKLLERLERRQDELLAHNIPPVRRPGDPPDGPDG